jgi:hypothetical protein
MYAFYLFPKPKDFLRFIIATPQLNTVVFSILNL